MATITIPKKLIRNDDLVILPRKEYEKMKSQMVPTIFLKGKAAKRLDKRVSETLEEYHNGKAESLESFLKKEYNHLYKKYDN